MAIASAAPPHGISAEIGGRARPLVLGNGEIERFEVQHNVGIFALLDQLIGRGGHPQARHCRDLVALGLVGAGMADKDADQLIAAMPPHGNIALKTIAADLVLMAFMPPKDVGKKKAGSPVKTSRTAASGTSKPASGV